MLLFSPHLLISFFKKTEKFNFFEKKINFRKINAFKKHLGSAWLHVMYFGKLKKCIEDEKSLPIIFSCENIDKPRILFNVFSKLLSELSILSNFEAKWRNEL